MQTTQIKNNTTGIVQTNQINGLDNVISVDPTTLIVDQLTHFDWFLLVKAGILIILVLYLLMSIVVIRQIYMMTSTVVSKANKFILLIGYMNILIVLIILLFAIFL